MLIYIGKSDKVFGIFLPHSYIPCDLNMECTGSECAWYIEPCSDTHCFVIQWNGPILIIQFIVGISLTIRTPKSSLCAKDCKKMRLAHCIKIQETMFFYLWSSFSVSALLCTCTVLWLLTTALLYAWWYTYIYLGVQNKFLACNWKQLFVLVGFPMWLECQNF